MSLQYISDITGNKTAVVIPIDEWDNLKSKYPEIESVVEELPQWQKDILDSRRPFVKQPGYTMSMDDFLRKLEEEEADEEV